MTHFIWNALRIKQPHFLINTQIIDFQFWQNKFREKFSVSFFPANKALQKLGQLPTDIYLFKVNTGNTRTMCEIRTVCEICSNLTVKTPERRHGRVILLVKLQAEATLLHDIVLVSIVNIEQISDIVLVFSLLTLNK